MTDKPDEETEEMREMLRENARQMSFEEALKEQASKDGKRLASLCRLLLQHGGEELRSRVVIGDSKGIEISLGDIADGTLRLHEDGEGHWW